MMNSGAIPVDSSAIPVDSGAIPAGLPDSRWNLWGTVKYCLPSPGISGCIEQVTEIWVVGSYHCGSIRPMGRYQYMIYEGSIYRCQHLRNGCGS